MANGCISVERILARLDGYLNENDYISAERHLLYWLTEAESGCDVKTELLMLNELMGLYRKLGKSERALECADRAIKKIDEQGISAQVGAATSYLNAATVYKAFGKPYESLELFELAKAVYEAELAPCDSRLGGLYNNMALTLVDLKRFDEANELYEKAIEIMNNNEGADLEVAITYLNMATAAEARYGLLDADERISELLDVASDILDKHEGRGGYYAFVCEKCASVFGYYGRFVYENDLKSRARRIYEGN